MNAPVKPLPATVAAPTTSGPRITVGCKLPNGIHLDLGKPGEVIRRVTLTGMNGARVIGGYGITSDVPKDFFEKWMAEHKEHPAVKGQLIFAHAQDASVVSFAKEHAELRHGMEPLVPPKKVADPTKQVATLATDE